jgi:O-antigen biosynthesis protein
MGKGRGTSPHRVYQPTHFPEPDLMDRVFDKRAVDAESPKSTDGPKPGATTGILFDQWSRYASLAAAVRAMLPNGGTVLDVGSGALTLLRHFLPDHRITFIDPLLIGREGEGLIGGHFTDGAVPPGSFDVVVCVDVLEHVPATDRAAFLARMVAASRHGVVVSAPFQDTGAAKQTDDRVQSSYRAKHGRDYPWLAEHELNGLPDLPETRHLLETAGLATTLLGNGHVPWLNELLGLHVVLLDEPAHRPLLKRIGERFAQQLAQYDHLEPFYRHLVLADRRGAVQLPPAPDDAEFRASAASAWLDFRAWMDAELANHADALVQQAATTQKKLDKLAERRSRAKELENELREVRLVCRNQSTTIQALRQSLSWRLTAPVRFAARAPRATLDATRRALLALAHWCVQHVVPTKAAWKLKSAFFAMFAPLLKNTHEYREFQAIRRRHEVARSTPPPVIDAGHATLADVVVFGVIDWSFRIQRPQQLALELARKGHRLFYLAPGFVESNEPGYRITRISPELALYEVHLHAAGRVSIYEGAPDAAHTRHLAASLRRFLRDTAIDTNITFVDHPGWVELAAMMPRTQLVYDCMDNHHGFAGAGSQLPMDERRLLEICDAVIVTSDHLDAAMRPAHRYVRMVRNGCDPDHFAVAERAQSPHPRPVVGYFGALAEWFDVNMIRHAAKNLGGCDFLLVGADTAGVRDHLRSLPNVRFTGEIPYEELPALVEKMDVLVIPFVIDELTLATNPVKAYEALAAGKPVVATPMPELMHTDLAPFVRIGATPTVFAQEISAALADAGNPEHRADRIAFAKRQSWRNRATCLLDAVASAPQPRFGIVVVSWNGVDLTRRCVQSVLDDRAATQLDVVIVDNASTDGTAEWLSEIEKHPRVRVIRNADNLGFAAACNQGLAAAAERNPDVLVILNNDIVVTPGWARTIDHHLRRDASIGLLGPVTNNIGNEARIETSYTDLGTMLKEQAMLTGEQAGQLFELPVLAFFCVAMPRDVYEQIGDLDANFGTGFFEDDDYCQRVRAIGRRIVCAEDVFVHHELSASFDKIDQGERAKLFERNRAYYESKWGPWQRHAYRPRNRGNASGNAAAG